MLRFGNASWQLRCMMYGWFGEVNSFGSKIPNLGLQSNEDDVHGEGQSRCAHYEGQRYLLCCLANEDPWTWVLGDDPRCTWCAGWCNNVGCSPWVSRRDVDGSRHCRWTEHILPVDPEKAKIGTLLSPYHHELPSWVDVLLQGWQWLGLFEVDVPVVRHAMRLGIDAVDGGYDSATWVRPVNGIGLGQFVRNRKSKYKPYWLRNVPHKNEQLRKETAKNGQPITMKSVTVERQAHFFLSFWCHCRLVLSLWFLRRLNVTMLVSLFQDSSSQLAYLRTTTKSSADRLPRKTRFGVILEIDQLLIIDVRPGTVCCVTGGSRSFCRLENTDSGIWCENQWRGSAWRCGIGGCGW